LFSAQGEDTEWSMYFLMAKFFGGDGKGGEANGSSYEFTIFWKFIP